MTPISDPSSLRCHAKCLLAEIAAARAQARQDLRDLAKAEAYCRRVLAVAPSLLAGASEPAPRQETSPGGRPAAAEAGEGPSCRGEARAGPRQAPSPAPPRHPDAPRSLKQPAANGENGARTDPNLAGAGRDASLKVRVHETLREIQPATVNEIAAWLGLTRGPVLRALKAQVPAAIVQAGRGPQTASGPAPKLYRLRRPEDRETGQEMPSETDGACTAGGDGASGGSLGSRLPGAHQDARGQPGARGCRGGVTPAAAGESPAPSRAKARGPARPPQDQAAEIDAYIQKNGVKRYEPGTQRELLLRTLEAEGHAVTPNADNYGRWRVDGKLLSWKKLLLLADSYRIRDGLTPFSIGGGGEW